MAEIKLDILKASLIDNANTALAEVEAATDNLDYAICKTVYKTLTCVLEIIDGLENDKE